MKAEVSLGRILGTLVANLRELNDIALDATQLTGALAEAIILFLLSPMRAERPVGIWLPLAWMIGAVLLYLPTWKRDFWLALPLWTVFACLLHSSNNCLALRSRCLPRHLSPTPCHLRMV